MLWLKAWWETRWKMVWLALMSVLGLGTPLEVFSSASIRYPQALVSILLSISVVLCFLSAITLAGSGIETVSARPGAAERGAAGSTLFTLSLPVTRTRLFAVRTVIGVLETLALLILFNFVIWLALARLDAKVDVGLGYCAAILSSSVAVYALSACLATFCDEGWRFRVSAITMALLFMLSTAGKLPRPINIFRAVGVTAPLIGQQIPWPAIAVSGSLALLFFGAAVLIIQKRDY
jgi:hypothetical protein